MMRRTLVMLATISTAALASPSAASAQGAFSAGPPVFELSQPREASPSREEIEGQNRELERQLEWVERELEDWKRIQREEPQRTGAMSHINLLIAQRYKIKRQIAELASQQTNVGAHSSPPATGAVAGGLNERSRAAKEQLRPTRVPMPRFSAPTGAGPDGATAAPGAIGAAMVDVDPVTRSALGLPAGALVVGLTLSDSPARQAGLLPGDYILAVDDRLVGSAVEAVAVIARNRPGSIITLTVARAGRAIRIPVRVGERDRGFTP